MAVAEKFLNGFYSYYDLEGKTTHFTGFYTHAIAWPKIPKPPIVYIVHNSQAKRVLELDSIQFAK